ncbi:MAG: zinc-binding dehydrogenase [Lautropia sp.]
MKAVVLKEAGGLDKLVIEDVPTPTPAAGEVRVAIRSGALNRRDFFMTRGLYPKMQLPCVIGSDGAGVVESVGAGVDPRLVGREVVLYPARDWGSDAGGASTPFPGPGFRVLGMPDQGTLAEFVCTPATDVRAKPAHLDFDAAAALPLAGLTSWRAVVTMGGIRPGQQVLVTGAGSGTSSFAVLWAVKHGAKVWVTSGSSQKIEKAVAIGAEGGADYKDPDCYRNLRKSTGGFDLVIDSAGGDAINAVLDTLRMGGRYVFYGATLGNAASGLEMPKLFFKQARIQGTTMGSPDEFAAMIDFVAQHRLAPLVHEVYPMARIRDAAGLMANFGQAGKIVVRVS